MAVGKRDSSRGEEQRSSTGQRQDLDVVRNEPDRSIARGAVSLKGTGLTRRRFLVAVGAAGALAACSPSASPAAATGAAGTAAASKAPAQSLIVGLKSEPAIMNPVANAGTATMLVLANIYDPLLRLGNDGKPLPGIAESWKSVGTNAYEFKIRSGVKFHNGADVTADAVKYSLDYSLDAKSDSQAKGPFTAAGATWQVVDSSTIRITTATPYATLLVTLADLYIVPPNVAPDALGQQAVGTGAYKFVQWTKGSSIVLQRNEDYWGGAKGALNVTLRVIPDDATRQAALKAGEVDLMNFVSLNTAGDLQGDTKLIQREGYLGYLGVQQLRPPFDNKQVRQAMLYAIDINSAMSGLMKGRAKALASPFFPNTPGFDPSLQQYPYDTAKAKSLLAAAGYPNGFTTELNYSPDLSGAVNMPQLAEFVAAQLAKVGVTVKLKPIDNAAFFGAWRTGDFPMYTNDWPSDNGSGRYLITSFYSTTRGWYYKSPQADTLLDAYFATPDEASHIAAGKTLNKFLYDEAPWIVLIQFQNLYGARQNVNWDAQPSFGYTLDLGNIQKG